MDYAKIISLIISLLSGSGPANDIVKTLMNVVGQLLTLLGVTSSNMDVAWAQRALKKLGFDPGPIDNVMGPKTQKAIVDFQRSQGLETDGWLGGETQTKLRLAAGDA